MVSKPTPKPSNRPSIDHLRPITRLWFESTITDYELEPHHFRLLLLAAEAWDRGEQAREVIAKKGLTFTDRFKMPRARPEVAIERDSRIAFARMVRELGLDLEPPQETPRPYRRGGQGA